VRAFIWMAKSKWGSSVDFERYSVESGPQSLASSCLVSATVLEQFRMSQPEAVEFATKKPELELPQTGTK
jgi:hypothetical protein